ncbi:hypothetical protein HN51_052471 [Arachis hypogaea]
MIQGYASNGLPKKALDLFFEMQMENLRLDCYAMVGVLSACASIAFIDFYAKCGSITSAVDIFRMMKEKDRVVFNAIIFGLAMDGHIWATFGVFGQMKKYGIQPDGNTFVGLLCGCTHAGLVNDGRQYFDSMSHVFSLSPTIEHYGCMVDLLSRVGLLVEAHNLNKRDTSHPMSPKIYENIESLFKELREVGYSPTTEFVFFDIEEKEKEYFLGCHSEKLAVAFFLINTGANDIICVVKNLCVCGDCHEAIKLISKVTGRKIIIRDNNRFHCFREGTDLQNYGQEGIVLPGYHYDVNFITIHSESRFPGLNIWLRNGQMVEVKLSLRCLLIQT